MTLESDCSMDVTTVSYTYVVLVVPGLFNTFLCLQEGSHGWVVDVSRDLSFVIVPIITITVVV